MPDHVVVVGASAGGVEALVDLAASLPADLPAAMFVVLHVPSTASSALPDILSRHGPLRAGHGRDGEPIERGRIYVAPPDHHLLLRTGHVRLTRGPRENGHRPAVDPLFRSAAREYASRVIGVVLSGALDDGTAGLLAIKSRGGVAVVQDPGDALYPGMPTSAAEHAEVDHVLAAASMGRLLAKLTAEPATEPPGPAPTDMTVEVEMEGFSLEAMEGEHPGEPSGFSCPDCNGVLWEIQTEGLRRYRCRVGHAWSPESLLIQQSEALEAALWIALRTLEERAALARRLAEPARRRGHSVTATRFEEQATEAQQAARQVRNLLLDRGSLATAWPPATEHHPADSPSSTERSGG
ncbi:MAG TPA: chemotaxis protein CheB [Actinomycetes bacterium]|nr:chemotaxis protein CheB [Actinomycetes bacterium]